MFSSTTPSTSTVSVTEIVEGNMGDDLGQGRRRKVQKKTIDTDVTGIDLNQKKQTVRT